MAQKFRPEWRVPTPLGIPLVNVSSFNGGAPEVTAFASLRAGRFRALWTASLFSKIGTFFQITAGSWLIWELTSSPVWVGRMAASRNLPLLFVALPAGVLADRFDRPSLVRVTQVGMGLASATMATAMALGRNPGHPPRAWDRSGDRGSFRTACMPDTST